MEINMVAALLAEIMVGHESTRAYNVTAQALLKHVYICNIFARTTGQPANQFKIEIN